MPRFVYARYKSETAAWDGLEDCFATGELSPGERPRVEKRDGCWCITIPWD